MTIKRLNKRYYGLAFFISILFATIIIVVDHIFHVVTFIPYTYNENLKIEQFELETSKKKVIGEIGTLTKKNDLYLKYKIEPEELKKELSTFLNEFSSKIKIMEISVVSIIENKEYYNLCDIQLKGISKNDYVNQTFVNETIKKLIKEIYPNNSSNIREKDGMIVFEYKKIDSNDISIQTLKKQDKPINTLNTPIKQELKK